MAPETYPWQDATLDPDTRARLVVAEMTEDEKFSWLSGPMAIPLGDTPKPDGALGSAAFYPGIDRLGIPAMQQADASLGISNLGNVRPGDNATALPASLLLGASFDIDMARQTGEMVGREARAKGFNVQLAGGANLVREPRGGRNFEYVSEDALLTGQIAGHSVAGVQSQGIVSTMKHFVLNAQETGRVMVSSDLSEPAMRESDLLAFQIGIEIGQPGAIMPGYNLVNGDYASENTFTLKTVLKGDWGYPGWVMADWGATHSTEAMRAGLDVQSGANLDPEPFFAAPLREAVADGRIPQARIDEAVARQLRSLFAVGAIDHPPAPGGSIDHSAHRLLAQRAAEGGITLLKNDGLLPLSKGAASRVLVVGHHADKGVLSGGGSSNVNPIGSFSTQGTDIMGMQVQRIFHPSVPVAAVRAESGAAKVVFEDGRDLQAACKAAREADLVLVFAEEWRSEGLDQSGLSLPEEQDALIAALAEANPETVVILETGGPVLMPWLAKVRAVLAAFYPGQGGAEAIAGILWGRVCPSGRLPVTFPASEAQLPHPAQRDPETTTSNPGMERIGEIFHVDYDVEGADTGYRWFAREGHAPLFPFGFGLSYTSFEYSALRVERRGRALEAQVAVTNTGKVAGAEVTQVYVSGQGLNRRLAGFAKTRLDPGETRVVVIPLEPRLFARWQDGWQIAAGPYTVCIGSDATAMRLCTEVPLPNQAFRP
ncbi:glycoside hydrolase family 3 C-terminal domain-containing protein [Salipiger bermudensis]|uniref:beta-glucosidase n=1 Tax=Salipiger bermudensis TaxID=344736 RepID=UPI001C99FA7F|nr:glycoside hydrolase family 3 C-terminal domain-containing protein [Salipiger bermudensis]MBY6005331.1 glycoside hydrolase family 3 C-terminal domain-containing protein [Salipiger bermudensis]